MWSADPLDPAAPPPLMWLLTYARLSRMETRLLLADSSRADDIEDSEELDIASADALRYMRALRWPK